MPSVLGPLLEVAPDPCVPAAFVWALAFVAVVVLLSPQAYERHETSSRDTIITVRLIRFPPSRARTGCLKLLGCLECYHKPDAKTRPPREANDRVNGCQTSRPVTTGRLSVAF